MFFREYVRPDVFPPLNHSLESSALGVKSSSRDRRRVSGVHFALMGMEIAIWAFSALFSPPNKLKNLTLPDRDKQQ